MYYDTYRGKKRRKRGGGCLGWLAGKLMKLLILAFLLIALAAGALYALPVAVMNIEPTDVELSLTDGLPGSRVNILLLGLDFLEDGRQRSDSMIIASVGYDGVRLTSVMRDTLVEIPGHGQGKINSAYALGGADLAMRTVNEAFDLNITNYAAVDIKTLVDLVDALGGVEIALEENEIEHLNKNAWDTYKKITRQNADRYARYANSLPVTRTGTQRLNGLFAAAYARIRYADSDYVRTARQREVISALLGRMREIFYDPRIYARLWDVLQNSVQTNLTLPELISLGEKVLISGNVTTTRVPQNEYILDDGSSIRITQPEACVRDLHAFIYG